LEIAYEEAGPENGPAVILLHGFPDDPRVWDGVAPPLAARGYRVLVPWLRGYGATRFLDPATPRSGQQAALGADLLAFMDALDIARAALAGYDWGGRAACIVAALWPERARCLLTMNGYNVQNIAASARPAVPEQEYRHWYQWYFHTERGRAGLAENRRELCRLLWELWSPNMQIDRAGYELTAASFDNPDFVDVVIHSYRHRHRAAPGDPALEPIERSLAAQPPIRVPSLALHGAADGVDPPANSESHGRHFAGPYQRRIVPLAGHFLPREAPDPVVAGLVELMDGTE
jgi:pimeloyl-ACP methyl ester carboxylesterase